MKLILRYDHIFLEPDAQPPHTRPPPEWRDPSATKEYGQTRLPIERVLHRAHLTTYVDVSRNLRLGALCGLYNY